MLWLVLCSTQLVFFIGCVLSCCHVLCEHVLIEFPHQLHVRVLFCTRLVICLLAMCCVFVLCEHVTSVLVFCVPRGLMSIVLTPPILFPDNWLICPTCLPSLPSSFAPFIISLCLQSRASLSRFTLDVSCPVCPALSCQAFALFLFFPQGVVFVVVLF